MRKHFAYGSCLFMTITIIHIYKLSTYVYVSVSVDLKKCLATEIRYQVEVFILLAYFYFDEVFIT